MRSIDVRELLARPGSSTTSAVREPLAGLRTELVVLDDAEPVKGDLLLESIVEGILVSGHLSAPMTFRCARCLREFAAPVAVEVEELFVPDPDPEADDYRLDPEGELDPEPMVRDALGLAMPFAPLCRTDCKGLCERCGADRNAGECSCTERIDARWAPLQGLTFDD
ncbi:MAG: YceD family protein [Actinomycetota bacterium]